MMINSLPMPESGRLEPLDLLRGVAVLGILLLNIQLFAMPFAAYANPMALGDPPQRDLTIWALNHLLADQKFMTIFALLFGAGVALFSNRIEARGAQPAALHYRRMGWLLVFGLLHAYLLWYGDILVLYAVCGSVVFLVRRWSPRALLTTGLVILGIGSGLSLFAGWTMPMWPPEEILGLNDDIWAPRADAIANEVAAFRSGWLAQMPMRFSLSFDAHAFEMWYWGIWRACGLMCIGIALLEWRVLTGERSPRFYAFTAAIGLTIGLGLTTTGFIRNQATGWNLRDGFFLNAAFNYWGSIGTSLAYVAIWLVIWQTRVARGLVERLMAVGRMALSCYIAETIICTTIFYGHGLGWFGALGRAGQMVIVVAVWLVLLAVAPVWLAYFRFGPLEWLWRMLTYGRVEPIARGVQSASPA
jgi:uncharacterized protein